MQLFIPLLVLCCFAQHGSALLNAKRRHQLETNENFLAYAQESPLYMHESFVTQPSVPLLEIKDLKCETAEDQKQILKGVNLRIGEGEVHVIMGPNGSGKSTLTKVITGSPEYVVTGGAVVYRGEDIKECPIDERAHKGIFLCYQYPVEVPGVRNEDFLRAAVNAKRKYHNETEIDPIEFSMQVLDKLPLLGLDQSFLTRDLNAGFSGGEKKRNEILQMLLLDPQLSIFDETDSGLDVDALKLTADAINAFKKSPSPETGINGDGIPATGGKKSFLIITHYRRLLDMIKPDFVHVMRDGRIIKSGGYELANEIDEQGFNKQQAE